MNKYRVILILFLLFMKLFKVQGQQELSFNHYMFNSQLFNPAFVGLEDNLTISSINNLQWIGFEGNPTTNSILLDGNLKNNLGIGMQLLSDKIGPLNSNFIAIDASYHLELNNYKKLSLGLKLSGNDHNISLSSLDFDNLSDPNAGSKDSYFVTNIGFGLYYYSEKFYLGFSIPYFFEPSIINKKRHFYFSGGFKKGISEKLTINPNFLIKKVSNAPSSLDFSTMVFYEDSFWFGINYGSTSKSFSSPSKNGGNLSFITGFKLLPAIMLGYSFTSQLGRWNAAANSKSHEIFVKFGISRSFKKSNDDSTIEVGEDTK